MPTSLRLAVDGRVLDDRYHGIGRITAELLTQLAGDPTFDVVVYVRAKPATSRFDLTSLIEGAGFRRAVFDVPLTSPSQYLRWPAALRRHEIDTALFPYHLGAAISGKSRRYAIVHDCILEADPTFSPNLRTRWLYMLLTRVVANRAQVLTPSRASATAIHDRYGVEIAAGQIIPWGVDMAIGDESRTGSDNVSPLPAPPIVRALPDHYYFHVGARRPHKNVLTLIRVLASLPEDAHLVLVGGVDTRFGDPVPDAVRALRLDGRVHEMSGLSDRDLARVYQGARALLYPSLVEGFGLPLLEAMAFGVPVIASDIGVFREVAGDAAIFVPPTDVDAWKAAVDMLRDPIRRDELVLKGRHRAELATWAIAAARLREAVSRR